MADSPDETIPLPSIHNLLTVFHPYLSLVMATVSSAGSFTHLKLHMHHAKLWASLASLLGLTYSRF